MRHRGSSARAFLLVPVVALAIPTAQAQPISAQAQPTTAQAPPAARAPDRELTGTITRRDHQTYVAAPFVLPAGTERLVVAFDYDTRDQKTVIDLGVIDPNGFRGASGGNKASFTIAPSDATPSYLPGRLPPGRWQLALAVPNIREGVTARWNAKLWFLRAGEDDPRPAPVADRGPGWYRGDLHLHSGHSDGSCASQSGKRVPCPAFLSLKAAADRGLDFVALTEHNTTSHHAAIAESAPYFDRMLVIPGREITTFFGHFNIYGVDAPIDFRLTKGGSIGFNAIADRVHALGGILSVNHPGLPSGEACMGCGWTMPAADLRRADAVEVINGGTLAATGGAADSPLSGFRFWLDALAAAPLTAIGGSDNHDATRDGAGGIGSPTTWVYARALTRPAILAGIKAGRVFVAMTPAADLLLDLNVRFATRSAPMGATLELSATDRAEAAVTVRAPAGATLTLLDGETLVAEQPVRGEAMTIALPPSARDQIVRAVLRSSDRSVLAVSNAIRVKRISQR